MTDTSTGTPTELPANDGGILPPFSGEEVDCTKCGNAAAYTFYRPSARMLIDDRNGATLRRGPLPERLERHCTRCGFEWDEALASGSPGMTANALAHALDNCTPYPVELSSQVLKYMAVKLLGVVSVTARPDHPLWQYDAGEPPVPGHPEPAPDRSDTTKDTPR
ncbi:hypothetical protein [Streptomyces sp. NPDC059063]|uniref:hypothetical protein n=1 Tax=Streptomyces sp. NPDC059063 TaxID=3346712 RepID=UPI0036A5DBE7